MRLGVPRESFPGERRVAVVPGVVATFAKAGIDVVIERGAGESAGFPDAAYTDQGATVGSRDDAFGCEIVAQVRPAGAHPAGAAEDAARLRAGQLVIGFAEPLTAFA